MRLVTVKCPVSWRIGDKIDCAYRADRHVYRRLRVLRTLWHPSSVGAAHREMMTVQMDRVIGHGEIGHPDAHAITEPHRHYVDPGKDARVEGPNVELRHFSHLREGRAGIEAVAAHDEGKVSI